MGSATRAVRLVRQFSGRYVRGAVVQGEALEFLRGLRSDSAAIVFLDPPFNLGKSYSKSHPHLDSRPESEYRRWMSSILAESCRVLMRGGTLYLYHLPIWAQRFAPLLEEHLVFRHWIAVAMKNGFVRGRRLYPAHYALLMFSKGAPKHFTRPKMRPATCRHCGKYVKDYGGYTSIIESTGINLSDVWDDLSPVRHRSTKHRSANELPTLLFERVFSTSGARGCLYVDPFAGAGTGVLTAARFGMRFRACDIVMANGALIVERLQEFSRQSGGRKVNGI